jgi:hypothetical protein
MSHLSDPEFVDLMDGVLSQERARHLEACPACTERHQLLRDAVTHASEVDVPEPSPLFWEHFSARVREGVRHAEPDPAFSLTEMLSRTSVRWAIVGTFALALVATALWRTPSGPGSSSPSESVVRNGASVPAPAADGIDAIDKIDVMDVISMGIDQDAAWALVRTVADDVSWDAQTAAGMGTRPGSAERAARDLTADERSELLELLAEETRRSGA